MTSKTNLGLVEWAYKLLGQPYWWGTCCYPATQALLTRKSQQYPQYYSADRMKRYKEDIAKGAIVCDCVGLIKGYYWTRDDGKQVYGLDGRPDKGANGMFEAAKVKGSIATLPEVPGLLLYYAGHIGVYVGGGQAIEAQTFSKGVVLSKVEDRKWTHWCECRYIDYVDGEAAIPEAPVPNEKPTVPVVPAPPVNESDEDAPPPDFGTRILSYKKGRKLMSGDDVRAVQTRLVQLGYDPGIVDGLYGAKSEAAVRDFQTDSVIHIDGMVGPVTRLALRKI